MSSEPASISQTPEWILQPVSADATNDQSLLERITICGQKLPDRLHDLRLLLNECRFDNSFIPAVNLANAYVWQQWEEICESSNRDDRLELLSYASIFLVRQAEVRIYRRLAGDPSQSVRRSVTRHLRRARIQEVTIPDGAGDWDQLSWTKRSREISRHPQGGSTQKLNGVPLIPNIESLCEQLGIVSLKQLGWLLTATDQESPRNVRGPYQRFTIAKRDGSDRQICAPRPELCFVQRKILSRILSQLPVHDAAHGFVPGRSTVTNATPHIGAKIVLKFDLRNFFHTIHWSRVLGLLTSVGYTAGDCRLSTDAKSINVAVALTRLCTYTAERDNWQNCFTPQGAPTSPAISNLICRRLDGRLTGLAARMNGSFTRYADDLTFSFHDKTVDIGRFRWWVDQICHREGFFVNQKKLRIIRAHRRQRVTGIVVNDCLRVPREQRRRVRAIIHNCRQHGIDSQANGRSNFRSWLHGMVSYIHMVHPEEGRLLLQQVEELIGPNADE